MRNILILFTAVVAFMLTSCKNEDISKLTVAELKTGKITVADFEKSIIENKYSDDKEKAISGTMDEKREYLKEMIFKDIIFDLASINRLDTVKTLKLEFDKKVYAIAIMNGYVPDSISSKLYTEKDVRTAYEQRKTKYMPKHILIDVKKHKEAPAKAKIDSIYQKLKNGEKFEELANKYSDDVQTGVNGGELGWVFAYDMVTEFENTVIKMKVGEYSEPFLTEYGYHIIYLSDSKKNESLKSFEKEEGIIRKDLNQKYSAKFNDLFMSIMEDLIVRYDVKIDSVNIKQFIKQIQLYNEQVKNDEGADPLDLFKSDEKNKLFSKFGDIVIDANSLISTLKMYPKDKRPDIKGYQEVRMYIIEKIRNKLLEKIADDLGYTKKSEYIDIAKSRMYDSYKEKLINMYVKSKMADPTEDELLKHYEENKDTYKNEDGTFKEFIKVKASISNSLKGKRFTTAIKKWEKDIFEQYAVKINYSLLEETFPINKDDRK